MNAVQPAANEEEAIRFRSKFRKEKEGVLTQGLEDLAWFFEFDVEIPASAEGTNR